VYCTSCTVYCVNVDRIGDWLSAERLQLLQNRRKHYENQRDKIKQQVANAVFHYFSVLSCLYFCVELLGLQLDISLPFSRHQNPNLSDSSAVRILCAAETWTLLSVNARALEAFHMKCQRQLLQIKWHQFVRNDAIAMTTGLLSIFETITRRRIALFGHVARLPDDVPAHKALNCQVNLSLGRPPSSQLHRRPGRPRNRWIDQIWNDNNPPPADLWRHAVSRGHCGAMLRPLPAKR